MKPKLYLETTIPSYLTARPGRNLIRAAHQQLTDEWWKKRRSHFDLFTSQFVYDEAALGDAVAAEERLQILRPVARLSVTKAVIELTGHILASGRIPQKAATDAAHMAIASVHGMHFLLTWNCRHINNAEIYTHVGAICAAQGFPLPIICTPEELMGGSP